MICSVPHGRRLMFIRARRRNTITRDDNTWSDSVTGTEVTLAAAALVVAVIAIGRFLVFCLSDLAATSDFELRHLTRAGWTAVIALVVPIGGIVYLYWGKAHRPGRH
jgi:hypothetical protein